MLDRFRKKPDFVPPLREYELTEKGGDADCPHDWRYVPAGRFYAYGYGDVSVSVCWDCKREFRYRERLSVA